MGIIISIIKIVIVFGLIVVMHEGAHFLVAKKNNIYVREFAIGFGPKIFSKTKNGTVYSIRAIPFGGFNDLADNPKSEKETDEIADHQYFRDASVRVRLAIVLAGAIANILFAMLLFFTINLFYENKSLVVDFVGTEFNAYGIILPNDELKKVDDKKLHVRSDLDNYFFTEQPEQVKVTLIRDGKEMVIDVPTSKIELGNSVRYLLGVNMKPVEKTLKNQFYHSFWNTINFVIKTFNGYRLLFTGGLSIDSFSGPIGIGETIASSRGIYEILHYLAAISISLGIVNLIPIPGLDGGKTVLLLYKLITRKKVNEDVEAILTIIGVFILLMLALYVTQKDIFRFFIKQ